MTIVPEGEQVDAPESIKYRDTVSIIEPALVKLAETNKTSSDFLVEATKIGFFDAHQSKGALEKMAKSLLKTINGEG